MMTIKEYLHGLNGLERQRLGPEMTKLVLMMTIKEYLHGLNGLRRRWQTLRACNE
jgi:hypothetical protein